MLSGNVIEFGKMPTVLLKSTKLIMKRLFHLSLWWLPLEFYSLSLPFVYNPYIKWMSIMTFFMVISPKRFTCGLLLISYILPALPIIFVKPFMVLKEQLVPGLNDFGVLFLRRAFPKLSWLCTLQSSIFLWDCHYFPLFWQYNHCQWWCFYYCLS